MVASLELTPSWLVAHTLPTLPQLSFSQTAKKPLKFLMFNINANVTSDVPKDQYNATSGQGDDPQKVHLQGHDINAYIKSISNDPHQLQMSMATFCRAFPFHFMCDQHLRFVQIGLGQYQYLFAFLLVYSLFPACLCLSL